MKITKVFFFIFIALSASYSNAPLTLPLTENSIDTSIAAQAKDTTVADFSLSEGDSLSIKRLALVTSGGAMGFVGSFYWMFKDAWWDESEKNFTVQNDFEYALNIDKVGHLFGGIFFGLVFHDGLEWAGMNEHDSHLYGAILSATLQVGIDVKDAYASWGFSAWDAGIGSFGAFIPYLKYQFPSLKQIDFKYSYWINDRTYIDRFPDDPYDDYINHTFWITWNWQQAFTSMDSKWWMLQPIVGFSLNDQIGAKDLSYEVYLSYAYNFEYLYRESTGRTKRWVYYLNRFKLPSPTLKVYPKVEWTWTYPYLTLPF